MTAAEQTRARRRYDSPVRRQRAAETRERIVVRRAPSSCTASRSGTGDALTVRGVAERAGVNERTVYRHFANERELRDAVMARLENEADVDLDGLALDDIGGLTARILEYVSSFPLEPRAPRDPTLLATHQRQRDALLAAVAVATSDDWTDGDRVIAAAMLDVLWSVDVVRTSRRRLGSRPRRRDPRRHLGHRSRRGRGQEWSPPGPLTPAEPTGTGELRLVRCELDVERVEAAQHPRGLVVEPARVGRAVVLLRQPDVAHPVEDALDADAGLGASQRTAGTGVDAAAEGDVLARVGAVEAELGRALEAPGVAVGRAVEQHHRRTGRDVDAADRRRPAGQAEVGLHRALDAQRLLDELRDAVVVRAELVLELGILRRGT